MPGCGRGVKRRPEGLTQIDDRDRAKGIQPASCGGQLPLKRHPHGRHPGNRSFLFDMPLPIVGGG
jgi:hypothetical protein